ncbi:MULTISPECIES: ammonium transporter [Bacillaceae]|uniref:Ammonium transporter n=1 Tax=Cytobacillus firmus TaxID=1399 RepID=A0AA46SFJ8_CYTFI|nr:MULTISPECIES: ammonium transporter [Bacillaceae]MBG9443373.1 ammonium transporter [Cytobacillus firmus]MBY6050664.1 ammonium transporter [Cytobacillus firmus]MCC3645376.1 ammonium transporter [Cytobacillus oceanisediminis]MCS0651940.1 ammonium transporter [Cytobacillus firmus]MCU1804853.1 ammonium transporter [Cytobacillus firmus]
MDATFLMNSLWVMLGAILVIFMLGGFVMLEAGSTRMKNAGHIAGKTIFTFGLSSLVFWAIGFGFIFGDQANILVGLSNFFYSGAELEGMNLSSSVFFVFQMAFAGISITIALGGFAERAKLSVYLIFTVLFSAIVYPVVAHWIWGGGWLAEHGKQDFAGSTVVHLTGAMAALAATILLKPRIGKFNKDGSANNIYGHNQVYTALGVLILWVGWFGFNAGSTLTVEDGFFGFVALNTNLAAGAGAVAALIISWMVMGKSDVPTMLNGALAGLVAITASCAFVDTWAAVVIGFVSGILVFYSVRFFEKRKIDDPIFALSVHGAAGVWGTLSTGFFATPELASVGKPGLFYGGGFEQLGVQFMGVAVSGLYAFAVSFIILAAAKKVLNGLRVTEEEEIMGLDLSEHGSYGYPEVFMADENKKLSS